MQVWLMLFLISARHFAVRCWEWLRAPELICLVKASQAEGRQLQHMLTSFNTCVLVSSAF